MSHTVTAVPTGRIMTHYSTGVILYLTAVAVRIMTAPWITEGVTLLQQRQQRGSWLLTKGVTLHTSALTIRIKTPHWTTGVTLNTSASTIRIKTPHWTTGVTLHTLTIRIMTPHLTTGSYTAYISINNKDHNCSLDYGRHTAYSNANRNDYGSSLDNRNHTAYSSANKTVYDCSLDYRMSHIAHSTTAGWTYGKGPVDSIRGSV